MIRMRPRSLQVRLAVRMAALYVAATAIAVVVLIYQAYETAGTLNNRELGLRAADLARSVSVDPRGAARLDLPAKLASSYDDPSNADIFAIRSADGRLIAASPPSFGELVARWPIATDDSDYFRLSDLGAGAQEYYGLSVGLSSPAGPLSVSVARAAGADILVHSLLREFMLDIAWVIPLLVVITLVIGILAIRSGFKPLTEVSAMAAAIGPGTMSLRLPDKNLPSEISPLVAAMNRTLDRIAQGFDVQRRFTANAAHELRTPLAIVTVALEAMDGNGELAKIKADVARMNRLIEQLLRVARLDAIALDVSGTADLNEVAAGVVATMAPWTLAQHKAAAFSGNCNPVRVRGNAHAIEDSIRNLVENAVAHSPPGTEVLVSTHADGSVSVADRGPGVPPEQRELIFERFSRGKGLTPQGAGLGLAIVKEIVNAHHGSIRIDDNPGGGAVFTLCFPLLA